MRELGYRVVDALVDYAHNLPDQPVTRYASRATMEELLSRPLPERGSDPDEVLDVVLRDVFSHVAHHSHPRFFGFVSNPSNFVSVLAEALVAGFNPFCGSWLVSSGPSQIELVTIDWLRQICGLPEGTAGLFVSGGSAANLTALAAARHAKLGENCEGATVYCSDQTHSSIHKALTVLGMRADQIRIISSDDQFRLPTESLRQAIETDRATGKRPFCVVASAGTTNTGAVDPLPALAQLCQEQELWLHVDGAYGAPVALTAQGKTILAGLELADSLSLDPHKWLFQPYEIGCVLLRSGNLLHDTFAVHPDYLRDVDRNLQEVNFRDYGIQLTRSFHALKLWMSLTVFGLDAFREAITWGLHLAEIAERAVQQMPHWEVMTPAQLGIITFRFVLPGWTDETADAANQAVVDAMIDDGFALVTSTVIHGRTVLRLCTINPRTTEEDVKETLRRLNSLAVNA